MDYNSLDCNGVVSRWKRGRDSIGQIPALESTVDTDLRQFPERMKLGSEIVFLFRDSDGIAAVISEALRPISSSKLTRLEDSFELSLERYGIRDHKASGNIINYLDEGGFCQVSVLLLQYCEPPILACAVSEVLALLARENSSSSLLPTILAPFVVASSKLKGEGKTFSKNDSKVSLYGVRLGPESDVTRDVIARTQETPSTLQILHEPLACFLHLVRVLNFPAVVIVGQISQIVSDKAKGEDLKVLHEVGELLANSLCLGFSRDGIVWNPSETSKHKEEPWRALYG